MEKVFKVSGMSCGHCSGRVTQALENLEGTSDVYVSLDDKTAKVTYDASVVTIEKMKHAITESGYDVVE